MRRWYQIPINTSTGQRASVACGNFERSNSKFWYLAAHYDSDDPKMIEAEGELKAKTSELIKSLQDLLVE